MIFVLFLIVGVIIVLVISRHRKNVGISWQEAAKYLGLRFENAGLFQRYSMTGRLSGFLIDVSTFSRGSGKGSRTYTGYRLTWPRSLNMGLNLSRQGIFSGVSSLLGQQDLLVGDPAFDAIVVVKGTDIDRIRDFLDRKRRTQILRLQERFSEYEIDDRGIFCCKSGLESDTARLVRAVQNIVAIAKTMTGDEEEEEIAVPPAPVIPPPLPHGREKADEEEKPVEEAEEVAAEEESEFSAPPEPVSESEDPPPPEPILEPADVEVPAEKPKAEGTAAPVRRDDALSKTALDLFDRGRNRYEIGRHFDTTLKGTEICGSGYLRRVTPYSNDREFGRGPGAIAEIEICQPEEPLPGIIQITGLIQLPEETEIRKLREQVGKEATVCGTLTRCDAFTGKIFLSSGEVAV